MGNRAVITANTADDAPSIYLHWNGGVESVLAFLHAAKTLGFSDPLGDEAYGMGYLQALTAMYFGDGLSTGVGPLSQNDTDNSDNGLYILGKGFTIAKRLHVPDDEAAITAVEHLPKDQKDKFTTISAQLVRQWQAAQAAAKGEE